jgi:hypothetical protein
MNAIGRASRRDLIACGLIAVLAAACGRRHCEKSNGTQALLPEDPVDDSFLGCQKSCGARAAPEGLVLQPNAKVGDFTRCPVSGAAFRITEVTSRREYRGRSVFLCCNGCARYFDAHADEVLALRRL